jgi:hypothetical protein
MVTAVVKATSASLPLLKKTLSNTPLIYVMHSTVTCVWIYGSVDAELGASVGALPDTSVGVVVGAALGVPVGVALGTVVGAADGVKVEGTAVGLTVGATEGCGVAGTLPKIESL